MFWTCPGNCRWVHRVEEFRFYRKLKACPMFSESLNPSAAERRSLWSPPDLGFWCRWRWCRNENLPQPSLWLSPTKQNIISVFFSVLEQLQPGSGHPSILHWLQHPNLQRAWSWMISVVSELLWNWPKTINKHPHGIIVPIRVEIFRVQSSDFIQFRGSLWLKTQFW